MKVLKKKCVVIYDKNNIILTQTDSNTETYVGENHNSAEFDTPAELNQFIKDKGLKEDI